MLGRRHDVDQTVGLEMTVRCCDAFGRTGHMTVGAVGAYVFLAAPHGEAVWLRRLDAGRLRAALRDMVIASAELSERG